MRLSVNRSLLIVVISILVAALVYSHFTFYVFAAPAAAPADAICWTQLDPSPGDSTSTCCWTEKDPNDPEGIEIELCQQCYRSTGQETYCGDPYPDPGLSPPTTGENIVPGDTGVLEQPPTSSPFDPTAPMQGGVLEQQEQQTPPTFAPGTSPGVLEQLEQGGGLQQGFFDQQQPPADQGAAELPPPATEEVEQPAPVCQEGLEFNQDLGFCVPTECPEGQELNEETGICVLEEQPSEDQESEGQQQTELSEPEEEQSSEESDSEEDTGNN